MSDDPSIAPDEDAWLRFLEDSLVGLREAARRVNSPARRRQFEETDGWFGEPHETRDGIRFPDETAISEALIRMMAELRSEQFISAPGTTGPDLTRMDFHIEVPRKYERGIGKRSLPTDIQIAIYRNRLDLRIEAKKLLSEADIQSCYLGNKGLDRFDDVRSPYTLEAFGGMVAYVMDDDAVSWGARVADRLRRALSADRFLSTVLLGESVPTTSHIRDVDLKAHGIKGRFRTDVIHFVLEFEADPSLRPYRDDEADQR